MSLDFVAVDVETANSRRGSICAVGWAVVRDGQVVESNSFLCRPPEEVGWFDAFNVALHNIDEASVADRPRFEQIAPALIASWGDLPVIAHNAAFDIGAVRDAHTCAELPWPTMSYGCTLVWSRRLLDLPSHRLPVVCEHLGVSLGQHHDAGADAKAAAFITLELAARVGANSVEQLLDATFARLGRLMPSEWVGCKLRGAAGSPSNGSMVIPVANLDADPDCPLYGQTVVFTGGLGSMVRREAWSYVAELGGTPGRGVNNKTTVLVLGDGFRGETLGEFLATGKAELALAKRANGQAIEFWTELDFVEALRTHGAAPSNLKPVNLDGQP